MISVYAIISGPRTRPAIPKNRNPPIVPIRLNAIGSVDLLERRYGRRRLSIDETKSAP